MDPLTDEQHSIARNMQRGSLLESTDDCSYGNDDKSVTVSAAAAHAIGLLSNSNSSPATES